MTVWGNAVFTAVNKTFHCGNVCVLRPVIQSHFQWATMLRGGLGQRFSPGIFCPDQPTTLSALGVGRDKREEPCIYFIKTILSSTYILLFALQIAVQIAICVSCAVDKEGVKPEQEVNGHPVVAASPSPIST